PGWVRVVGMLAPIHKDLPVAVDVSFEQEEYMGGRLDNAPRVGSLTGHAGGEAESLGIVLGHALLGQLFGPRMEGKCFAFRKGAGDVIYKGALRAPDAGQVGFAVGCTGSFALGAFWPRSRAAGGSAYRLGEVGLGVRLGEQGDGEGQGY